MDIILVFETSGVGSIPAGPAINANKYPMRTEHDKHIIVNNISDPYVLSSFVSVEERTALIEFFKTSSDRILKNTGPLTLDITREQLELPVFKNLLTRLREQLGNFDTFTVLFFYVEQPHIIHNDDSFEFPVCYKGINIPLELEYISEPAGLPHLCFFDQYYLDGPAKFFNGSRDIPTYYNKCVYTYDDVHGCTTASIDKTVKETYFSHLRNSWLNGLSVNSIIEWVPGNAIVFDTVRLHCASNFIKQGIKSKLGLSIFTKVS